MFMKHIINFVAPQIFLLLCRALDEANVKPEDIDCLCYTKGEYTKTILAIFLCLYTTVFSTKYFQNIGKQNSVQ